MKNLIRLSALVFLAFYGSFLFAATSLAGAGFNEQALKVLEKMSLKEKIGQKLMLDFRYWCSTKSLYGSSCTQDFLTMNPMVKNIVSQNHIGGVILFSNNLKDLAQIVALTNAFQQAMYDTNNLPLLIGTDQEGGIVARLPRDISVSFPGNMAIAAAYLGAPEEPYAAQVGRAIARNLKAVGINVDFAPDVDVNINPLNPVIHVRSFSDDSQLVSQLGLSLSEALQKEGVAATLKHFPGHGDTITDSHLGLPVVNHTLEQAKKIDLYPFQYIINQNAAALIMTAHIQFPALDDSKIYAEKIGREIIVPATLSRKIQHDLLRKQLDYQGLVITDALDMGAIAQNFGPIDVTIKAFQAGDDIALMPISVVCPEDIDQLSELIAKIEAAVLNGSISEEELDQSVLRIITLKMKLGLLQPDNTPLPEKISRAQQIFADKNQWVLEKAVTNDAVTVVQNNNKLLPLELSSHARVHVLTPWLEQGEGITVEIMRLQAEHQLPAGLEVDCLKMADTDIETEKLAIDRADIVIVGNSTTRSLPIAALRNLSFAELLFPSQDTLVFPDIPNGDSSNPIGHKNTLFGIKNQLNEAQFAYQVLAYAKSKGKKTIFISLLAPYDLPNYQSVADAMLVGYDFYGYFNDGKQGYYRGPSMAALTRILFGLSHAKGKLPIDVPVPLQPTQIIYPRGHGLTT